MDDPGINPPLVRMETPVTIIPREDKLWKAYAMGSSGTSPVNETRLIDFLNNKVNDILKQIYDNEGILQETKTHTSSTSDYSGVVVVVEISYWSPSPIAISDETI